MLLSFSVSNFRSFRESQTLSMVASNRHVDHANHLVPIPGDSNMALPVAALYGPNGAGKSNLVKALLWLQRLVVTGTKTAKSIRRTPFALDRKGRTRPTELEIQFLAGEKAYVYGAKILDDRIEEEWLSELRGGSERGIFQRKTDDSLSTTIEYPDNAVKMPPKLDALKVVGGPPYQLFLNVIGTNLVGEDRGPIFTEVLAWFKERLRIITPESLYGDLCGLLENDAEFSTLAGRFLKQAATGVDELRVHTSPMELSDARIPKEVVEGLLSDGGGQFLVGEGSTVERAKDGKLQVRAVKSQHVTQDGDSIAFSLDEESDGTRRLLHLLPAIHTARSSNGFVFVIDEIDRSLHPLLAKGFVRAFLTESTGRRSQVIFSTHDTNFLDLELLRRDEIWFAEKKLPAAATELYSLSDFKVRKDLRVDKAYLDGRFEAVPPISSEFPEWVRRIMDELKPGPSGGEKAAG